MNSNTPSFENSLLNLSCILVFFFGFSLQCVAELLKEANSLWRLIICMKLTQ